MLRLLHKFRYAFLLLTAVACVLLWPGVKAALVVDNSLTVWFLEDDPALVPYHTFQERFGNDEVVILVVKDKKSLLSQQHFDAFIKLSQELEAIPEVAGVIGPGNAAVSSYSALGSTTKPLLAANTDTAWVKRSLAGQQVLRQQLFTADYKAARLLIVLKTLPDFDIRRGEILDRVQQVIARHLPADSYHLGGVGIIYAGLNKLSQQDFGFFLGIGYLVMFLLILFIYRKLLLLVYALGTVALATYITLGIYGALGFRLNLMTTLLPIIIILLGIMDVLHVLNERNQLKEDQARPTEAALAALANVFRPCLFTTLTTMAGFLALVASPMAILQSFGAFAALGIFLSFVFTFVLGVLLLPHARPATQATKAVSTGMAHLLGVVLQRPWWFTALSLLLLAASILGIFRLKNDTYTLGYFPQQHQVVTDHQAMEAAWGPYMPLELLVQPTAGRQLHDKEVVQAAAAFADSAQQLNGVGQVFGFHSLYQAGLEAQYQEKGPLMLQSQFYLAQVQKQLSSDYPELMQQFMHLPTQTGRITIFGSMSSARELSAKMDSLLLLSTATLGQVATVTPSGYQPMYAAIVQYVTESQVKSLLLALVLVFLLVWLFIRNLKLALLAVVPNFFPVILMMGFMGWMHIYLDTATASIAAIVLSFCIDDTIHFINHYQQARKQGQTAAQARLSTMTHVGPAIVITSLVLFLCYGLMIFGSLKTVELFGILTAVAIAGALYSQLFIFPLLLKRFDK
ncbi:efflux RND transporter permease subunit [Pontibacter beigongshangensis]|uniref:efflux RND transporter permease subunit n=1 Tax=Pontibacter beigongshangensis TaxID=2574733 RepID=UPI0016507FA9|nr:efflux RND transporter permease subunit [Pontibacter beigongshangensis]